MKASTSKTNAPAPAIGREGCVYSYGGAEMADLREFGHAVQCELV